MVALYNLKLGNCLGRVELVLYRVFIGCKEGGAGMGLSRTGMESCISGEGCEGSVGEGTTGALGNADSEWDADAREPFALLEMGEVL